MTDAAAGPDAPKRPVAFISHHSSQYDTAKHLKAVLERNGVSGWIAPDDIDPGVPFDQAIMQQVERSDLIVLLFCAQSDQSRHVKREVMLAEEGGKLLYPVRLEDIDAHGLAYWLKDYQWIDWIDRRDETISRLVETVKKQVAAPAGPAKPPPDLPEGHAPAPLTAIGGGGSGSWRQWLTARPKWLAGGIIGLLSVILIGLFITANDDPNPGADNIRPGQWQTTYRVADMIEEGALTDADVRTLQSDYENDTNTQCVTLRQARLPLTDMFDPEGSQGCEARNLRMRRGEISAIFLCQPPAAGETPFAVWLSGRYDRETMNVRAEYAYFRDTPQEIRFVLEQTGRYQGECN